MSVLLAIAAENFKVLRRDKVFVPALVIGAMTLVLAQLASLWGIEEYYTIIYDIGTAGFHLTGAIVAILWGTKMISDSRQEGSLEVQLAAPVGRGTWILGKFLGLSMALLLLGALLILSWQIIFQFHELPFFERKSVLVQLMLMCGWFVLAATAVFFAAISSQAIALFSCICMWVLGLVSTPILKALGPETPETTRAAVAFIARFWDISRFNLGAYAYGAVFPSTHELGWLVLYGLSLCGTLLALAALCFSRRDLV